MMKHCKIFVVITALLPSFAVANLTTMQHWDPSPVFSATNFMMPPHTHIANAKKTKFRQKKVTKDRAFGASFTGVIQGACRAQGIDSCSEFGSVCGVAANGTNLGDFRGTMYPFGMFLGNSPNGNSIWSTGIDDGKIGNITPDSINATQLPSCIKDTIKQISGNFDPDTGLSTPSGATLTTPSQATMIDPADLTTDNCPDFDPDGANADCTEPDPTSSLAQGPSIFNESKLKNDKTCFGSYSLPLEYKKYAIRMEMHAEFSDNLGITMQTGFANIKHKTTGIVSLTNAQVGGNDCDTIYPKLAFQGINGGLLDPGGANEERVEKTAVSDTVSIAQGVFDTFFINRIEEFFDSDYGINQSLKSFDDYSMEDVRIFFTFKNSHSLDRYFKKNQEDPEDWPSMLFTGYGWGGVSIPISEKKDYTKLLSLPFGNNGHLAVGGGIGMGYDFEETVEVGAEVGFTYFLSREETRPMPNHKLQRVIYPFYATAKVEPGLNWHFKAMMNAYEVLPLVSFWATYEFIEHHKDTYKFFFNNTINRTDPNTQENIEQRIFIPEVIECLSEWRAQFFNLAAVIDVNPNMQISFMWQQPISPRNAYYPVSVAGSFSFTF